MSNRNENSVKNRFISLTKRIKKRPRKKCDKFIKDPIFLESIEKMIKNLREKVKVEKKHMVIEPKIEEEIENPRNESPPPIIIKKEHTEPAGNNIQIEPKIQDFSENSHFKQPDENNLCNPFFQIFKLFGEFYQNNLMNQFHSLFNWNLSNQIYTQDFVNRGDIENSGVKPNCSQTDDSNKTLSKKNFDINKSLGIFDSEPHTFLSNKSGRFPFFNPNINIGQSNFVPNDFLFEIPSNNLLPSNKNGENQEKKM